MANSATSIVLAHEGPQLSGEGSHESCVYVCVCVFVCLFACLFLCFLVCFGGLESGSPAAMDLLLMIPIVLVTLSMVDGFARGDGRGHQITSASDDESVFGWFRALPRGPFARGLREGRKNARNSARTSVPSIGDRWRALDAPLELAAFRTA